MTLEKIEQKLDIIQNDVHDIDIRLARLETSLAIKTSIIGFIAGAVPSVAIGLISFLLAR